MKRLLPISKFRDLREVCAMVFRVAFQPDGISYIVHEFDRFSHIMLGDTEI